MFKVWHLKFALLMGGLFAVTVGYNACSNDASFDLRQGVNSIEEFNSGSDVVEDLPPVRQPRVLINGGDEFTNEQGVTLTLSPDGLADQMLISNDVDCSTGNWETFKANKIWNLSSLNQKASVFVKYKQDDDEETACVKDDIIHDDIAPQVSFSQGVGAQWISDRNITITYGATDSGSGVKLIECDLSGSGNFAACGNSQSFVNMVENQNYSLEVKAHDKAGNVSAPARLNWRPDYTAPVVDFNVKPASLTADTTPDFVFSGTDLGSGIKAYECQLDSEVSFTSCQSPRTLMGLLDGSHTLRVRAIDNVGLVSDAQTHTWVQDSMAPTVEITATPKAIDNSGSARFEFRELAGGIVSYECKVDQGTYQSCTSPFDTTDLIDGRHDFYVVGIDAVGNRSQPATYGWLIDTLPPTVAIIDHPNLVTGLDVATFAFVGQDTGSGIKDIQCALDGAIMQVCGSTAEFSSLVGGSHNLVVKAIDNAGNETQLSPFTWSIDNVAPVVMITDHPTDPTVEKDATFTFTATDSDSGIDKVECRLDGQAYQDCSDSITYMDQLDGDHLFSVRATDEAGNVSAPQTYSWTVDTTAPEIIIVSQPNNPEAIGNNPKIIFNVDDGLGSGVAGVSCLYQGAAFDCESGSTYEFPATEISSHSFVINVMDALGNSDSKTITWDVYFSVNKTETLLTVDGDRPVDILFVIDNSISMDEERANLGQNLHGMLDKIDNVEWQVAVTSTDVYGSKQWEDGRLADFDGRGLHILNLSVDRTLAQQLFENKLTDYSRYTNPLGIPNGDGREQAIYATYRVLDRALKANDDVQNRINADFIRESSDFVVVVLSDEDEFSDGNIDNVQYQPQNFVNWFNGTFSGDKSLTFHSIIVKPDDESCLTRDHYYGHLYQQLSQLTGGVIGSICDGDYANQLGTIGQSVAELAKTVSLQCAPIDADGDGAARIIVEYKGSGESAYSPYSGAYTIQGQKLVFDDFLPTGDFRFDYDCN